MLTMAAGFSVQIEDLHAVAEAFARLSDDAARLLRATDLAGTGGMGGRDPVLAAWRGRYDTMAAATWAASITATATLGAIATKLTATVDTYLAAEHAATPRPTGQPPPDAGAQADPGHGPVAPGGADARGWPAPDQPSAGRADLPWLSPPSSTGSGGPQLPDLVAEYYPDGDPTMLRAAATAWSALAEGLERLADAGDAAFQRLIATGEGAAFSAMRTFWAQRFTPCAADPLLNAVLNGAGTLSASCAALAELIEHTRSEILGAVAEAARDMTPLELPAALLSEIAWGIPELELLVGTGALAVRYLNDYRTRYLFALDQLVERLRPEDEERLRRVAVPPRPDAPVGVGLTDVGEVTGLDLTGSGWDGVPGPHPMPDMIHVAPDRASHILTGDKNGGGHAPGAGIPGQSQFPPGWSSERILAATLSVARDPDVVLPARGGRLRVEGTRDGVMIRVIMGLDGYVVTSVPLSGPGVVRNPGER